MTHTHPVEYYAQVRNNGRTLEVRPRAFADWGILQWALYFSVSTLLWGIVIGIGIMAYRLIRSLWGS